MKKFLTLLLFFAAAGLLRAEGIALAHLTVEGRQSPLGLDVEVPRLGWQLRSEAQDVRQVSYRVLVASSAELLARDSADVWDSGEVRSDQSQWVACGARTLLPNRAYFWKVRVTTNQGRTGWSRPAQWSTGLMAQTNWAGHWIGMDSLMADDTADAHSRLSVRYLRKGFRLKQAPKRATIHLAGLGLFTLYLNGERVGDDVLTPLPTDYRKTVAYNTYDVTGLLRSSDNAVGVALAAGRYFSPVQHVPAPDFRSYFHTYGFPKLLANLIVEYADGSADTIRTDTSWRLTSEGPVRYANEYDGELFDARREMAGWSAPSFDDSGWLTARRVSPPEGELRGNVAPPMEVYASERPVSVRHFSGRYLVDFGTNNAGRVRLHCRAAAGDTVRIRHAEFLLTGDSTLGTANLRSAQQTACYVGDGRARSWAPEFSYYGFRYVEITGVDSLRPDDLARELIADRMDDEGTAFYAEEAGGESLLNLILQNARRGVRSNYKGMPVDCPQRDERMPWLGDRTTGCTGESYLMDNRALYAKWADDIGQSQRPDGNISDVAPAYWELYTGNVTWPAALPFACDMVYRQYGDLQPMRRHYGAVKRFLRYVRSRHGGSGLIAYDRYGDWCVPPEEPQLIHSQDPARKTEGRLIASAYYFYLCQLMRRYAPLVGEAADTAYFADEAELTRRAINASFLRNDTYDNGTATANLLPLAMGIVPEAARNRVDASLLETVVEKNGTHVSTGVIGTQWLLRYLSDAGHGEVAYELATTETYPGWGYMLRHGATTVWELWNGDTADPYMNSGNHVMLLGDLVIWCYERLAGIRPDEREPGFKHIVFRPDFSVGALSAVRAAHPSPYGLIRSEWQRSGGEIVWDVTVPPNTSAELHLPDGSVRRVGSGRHHLTARLP